MSLQCHKQWLHFRAGFAHIADGSMAIFGLVALLVVHDHS